MGYIELLTLLRPEIVCLAVLGFVQIYAYCYKRTTAGIFRVGCWAALSHLAFDMLTVVTVNNLDSVPAAVNKAAHLAMYISAMIFCYIHLDYVAAQILSSKMRKTLSSLCKAAIVVYIAVSPFLSVIYVETPITNYSAGAACHVAMGMAYLFFAAAVVLLIVYRKRVEKYVFYTTLLTNLFMSICVTTQIMIPTFLFTGCGISVVTLGMFFGIENPVKYYQQRAMIDLSTGTKSKNCYNEDVKTFAGKEKSLTALVCDINWLKDTNDTYGHLAGDELIRNTAQLLMKGLKNAYGVYRFGGDEFVAVFMEKDTAELEKEVEAIYAKCGEISQKSTAPLSVALGFASMGDEGTASITEVISLADKRMYLKKKQIKEKAL